MHLYRLLTYPKSHFCEESFISCAMLARSQISLKFVFHSKIIFHKEIQISAHYYVFYKVNYDARGKHGHAVAGQLGKCD